jgi:hypothetical protein
VVDALQRHIDHPTVATLALLLLRGEN